MGFLKLVCSPSDGEVLGVHCIGPHASELVHLGSAVMALGGTLRYFTEAVFNYPTLGEAYKYAAHDARAEMKRRGLPGAQAQQPSPPAATALPGAGAAKAG